MEIELQESFKNEILGKVLIEYVNRKDSSGYHDVSMEQFASVSSALLHALESYPDILFPNIDLENISFNDEMQIDLDEASLELDNILHRELEPIKEVIREKIKSYPFHGSDHIKLNGDVKEDTMKMFEYVMGCNDIYDKAYVMQSVLDRVLSIYFDTLKDINK